MVFSVYTMEQIALFKSIEMFQTIKTKLVILEYTMATGSAMVSNES